MSIDLGAKPPLYCHIATLQSKAQIAFESHTVGMFAPAYTANLLLDKVLKQHGAISRCHAVDLALLD